MAIPTPTSATSRRAMLTAALGATAAAVATALGRPDAARGADAGNLIIGADNHGNTPTVITNDDVNENAFAAYSTGIAAAILGTSSGGSITSYGVRGNNATGTGVRGDSTSATGVAGDSTSGIGVYGVSGSSAGVWGDSTTGDGVRGATTTADPQFAGVHGTGFRGVLGIGSGIGSAGVHGESAAGGRTFGVHGVVTSVGGYGVAGGSNAQGTGIFGYQTDDGLPVDALQNVGVHGHSSFGRGVVGSSEESAGVFGETNASQAAGVHGVSGDGYGVWGASTAGVGIGAGSSDNSAVTGYSSSATKATIFGHAVGQAPGAERTGVMGYSGQTLPTSAPAKTGVYGYAVQDSNARGVHGRSTSGRGVFGQATTGYGVYGLTTTGSALYGIATGTGGAGYALRTDGRIKLDKTSGSVVISSGLNVSAAVTPGVDLTASSLVIATLQGNGGAGITVQRVALNTSGNTFTIYLTGIATANVKVAWLVLN